jgi:hypothetical protein
MNQRNPSTWRKLAALALAFAAAFEARAAEPRPLVPLDAPAVTFRLEDRQGKTPQIVLFTSPDQAGTADSINYWRDTPNKEPGVVVEFKGIRFLRSADAPDELIVRLVGIKNELELNKRVSLAELESGKPQKFHFGPVAMGAPGVISGTTDAEMHLAYDPANGTLKIPKVSGSFEWKRPFFDAQADTGSLTDVSGKVGELPEGASVLRAREE